MGTLISVNCPVCRRPYVLRVNLEQLRETRQSALCARCGQRFDLLELVEKATEKIDSSREHVVSNGRTTISGIMKKIPSISERTPPPTRVEAGSKPGVYRATVDKEAVRRARLRTRSRDEIRRALALPEIQALHQSQPPTTHPVVEELKISEVPPSPTVAREVIADLNKPFSWFESADTGLNAIVSGGPELTAILESLLMPSDEEKPET